MPSLNFVLPHWMYWGGLILFPLLAIFMLRNHKDGDKPDLSASLSISYFLLITAGFIGMHRLYLKNFWGLVFIPIFIALLFANATSRDTREGISNSSNDIAKAEFLLERAQKDLANGNEGAQAKIEKQETLLSDANVRLEEAEQNQSFWQKVVQGLALLLLGGIIFDAFRIPSMKRQCDIRERDNPIVHNMELDQALITADGGNVMPEHNAFSRFVGKLNNFVGTFVAYWSVIAVIVYYYEVIARYVFNSPTNWAHESMFLMFGAQYLLAGGFCLRENAHVRVDVLYTHFSERKKAIVDILTSVFFYIFMISLLVSGWTFFMDSYSVGEVSFTEWGIQYYPIKLSLTAGALLLLLQGTSRLLNDINTLRQVS